MFTITEAKRSGICEEGMIREIGRSIAQRDSITSLVAEALSLEKLGTIRKKEFAQN